MITSPADQRLAFNSARGQPTENFLVRAVTFGGVPVRAVQCQLDGGAWRSMQPCGDGLAAPQQETAISVRVIDGLGGEDIDTISYSSICGARTSYGSDQASINAWSERHVLGTQLGPTATAANGSRPEAELNLNELVQDRLVAAF